MSLPIPAGTYGIDPVHSQFGFSVTHLGISLVHGTFDNFSGSLTVGSTLDDTTVTVSAEMASVNSGNSLRDQHIQGAEFFDVANHQQMTFTSTSIREAESGYQMTGNLTIKGISQPVDFQVVFNGSATFPVDQSTHYGFGATAPISRSAFDISYGVPMVSDDVELRLDVQFVQPATA